MAINNMRNSERNLYNLLDVLDQSGFEFFLHGSRYYGTYSETSDWDFFVQEQEGLSSFLTQNGFINCIDASYLDVNCNSVWQHLEQMVHIQVSKDAMVRRGAQIVAEKSGLFNHLAVCDKDARKTIWNTIFKMVDGTYEDIVKDLLKDKII